MMASAPGESRLSLGWRRVRMLFMRVVLLAAAVLLGPKAISLLPPIPWLRVGLILALPIAVLAILRRMNRRLDAEARSAVRPAARPDAGGPAAGPHEGRGP